MCKVSCRISYLILALKHWGYPSGGEIAWGSVYALPWWADESQEVTFIGFTNSLDGVAFVSVAVRNNAALSMEQHPNVATSSKNGPSMIQILHMAL